MLAASTGQVNIMYVGGRHRDNGESYVGYIAVPWAGGMGARPSKDGLDVVETDLTNSLNYPTEAAEWPTRCGSLRATCGRTRAGPAAIGAGSATRRAVVAGATGRCSRCGGTATDFAPWGLQGGRRRRAAGPT